MTAIDAMNAPATLPPELVTLHKASVAHREGYGCGGYSFEDGAGLFEWVRRLQPRRVLELGTALGYTAALFARAAPKCHVDTIEADGGHVRLAQSNIQQMGLSQRVAIHQGDFESVLLTLNKNYDLIFFDGYAPSVSLLRTMPRLIVTGGHLICANLGLAAPRDRLKIEQVLMNDAYWLSKGSLEAGATLISQKIN